MAHAWDQRTLAYGYDALSRVLSADEFPGAEPAAVPARAWDYTFDRAGNRLGESLALNGGTPTVRTFSYNAANQISSAGYSYDANGNLLADGVTTYTWDRADRLLSAGGASYAYDGLGNRVRQTVGTVVTQVLLDLQPGLTQMLAQTAGAATDHFVHGPAGVLSQRDSAGGWEWPLADGLGSVRSVADNANAVLETRAYDPYGQPLSSTGTPQTPFGFTGELADA